jgi:hypothetical protein
MGRRLADSRLFWISLLVYGVVMIVVGCLTLSGA